MIPKTEGGRNMDRCSKISNLPSQDDIHEATKGEPQVTYLIQDNKHAKLGSTKSLNEFFALVDLFI